MHLRFYNADKDTFLNLLVEIVYNYLSFLSILWINVSKYFKGALGLGTNGLAKINYSQVKLALCIVSSITQITDSKKDALYIAMSILFLNPLIAIVKEMWILLLILFLLLM